MQYCVANPDHVYNCNDGPWNKPSTHNGQTDQPWQVVVNGQNVLFEDQKKCDNGGGITRLPPEIENGTANSYSQGMTRYTHYSYISRDRWYSRAPAVRCNCDGGVGKYRSKHECSYPWPNPSTFYGCCNESPNDMFVSNA